MHYFRKAKPEDAEFVLKCRDADVGEILAAGYEDIVSAMKDSIKISKHCFIGIIDEKEHVICGVLDNGTIWAMTTDECMEKHKKEFYKMTKRFLSFSSKINSLLSNFIWSKNHVHIRFLEHFGFTICHDQFIINDNTKEKFIVFYKQF